MKRSFVKKVFHLLALLALFTNHAFSQKPKPIRVLIVDGFSNHDWKQTTRLTKWMLEESGRFEVEVSTVPRDSLLQLSWKPAFKNYAVVIQNTNNLNNQRLRWPRHAEEELESFVKDGGGLYILHSANNAFPHWAEYDKMIGLGWRPRSFGFALEIDSNRNILRLPPGEGSNTRHGKRFNAVIQILNRHPININFPDKWQTADAEVYNFPRGLAENVTVLSYAYDSTDTRRNWPVEWVVAYGKGRVYNSSMGHLWAGDLYPPGYRCIGYQTTVIRATEWLATGKVSYPVPRNFPTENAPVLRSESTLPTAFRPDQKFYIFLCLGQSNMEGGARLEAQDSIVDKRFKVLQAVDCPNLGRTKDNWYTAVPPLNRCRPGIGPADYFGKTMVAKLPADVRVGVINVSVAGCKIELYDKDNYRSYLSTAPDWLKNFANQYGGNPYGHLIEMARLAQKDGVIKGILLHQGESNTNDSSWPQKVKLVYENILKDLNLRSDAVPLLAGELVNADQQGTCASMNAIIGKLPQAIPNSYVISSAGCAAAPDRLHFNAAGFRELGRRYAEKMLSLLGY